MANWASAVKKSLYASERDEQARANWWQELAALGLEGLARLVFIDETSSYLNQSRSYGRAASNKRVIDHAPKGKKERSSLLAAITPQGLVPQHCLVHPESVDKAAFKTFLAQLLPQLDKDSILVMDNWRVHHGHDVEALVESHACSIRYLPAYSPDFNPIELLFSKIKAFIKKLRPQNTPDLIQAFVEAIDTLSLDDVKNAFAHCGY